MVEQGRLPSLCIMTGLTGFTLELSFMSIFMAVRGITGLVIDWLIFTLYVAFIAFGIQMLAVKLKTSILRCIVVELR